jgi:uncharacterized RDD family membrane protein YckC
MECPCCQTQVSAHAKQCPCCGEIIPPGQHLLEESGIVEPSVPVQSAEAPARRARDNGNYRFARLGDRFVAYVLDLALLFGLFAVIDAWTFMRWGRVDENEIQLTTASILIAVLLNAAILFLYGWLLEAAFGATLGKAMVGIRVVGTTQRGPMSSCALRNVLRIVDGLAFYLVGTVVAACSDIGQRVGDIFAQTAVIEDSFGTSRRLAAVVLWIAIIGGAGWTVPHICSSNSSKPTPYLNQVALRVGRTQTTAYFRLANFSIDVQLAPQQ